MSLAQEIREARKLAIIVGDAVYFARRPTYEELGGLFRENLSDPDIARRFVTGWKNVRARDLFKDGTDELVEFDQEIWNEAIGDMPDTWRAIVDFIVRAAHDHHETWEAARKNWRAG